MTKRRLVNSCNWSWIALGLMAMSTVACGSGADVSESTQTSDGTLALGSRGEEVRSVYEYLKRYGYFENEQLRKKYPDFVPIVAEAPADQSVFDQHLLEGVLAYQRLSGLDRTGVIDAATRTLMATPRCSHPDVDPEQMDETQKWALLGTRYNKTNITYGFYNYATGLSAADTRAAMVNALTTWSRA